MKYDRCCADCFFVDLKDLSGKSFFCKKFRITVSPGRRVCSRFKSIYQPVYYQLDLFDYESSE